MKKQRLRQRSSTRAGSAYEVGYGLPPKQHRFKPGRSGNPKGRPKGSKNEATILSMILNRKIEIRESGISRRITVLEAVLLKFTEEALRGNPRAATFLLDRYRPPDSKEFSAEQMSREDQEILDAFIARAEAQLRRKKLP